MPVPAGERGAVDVARGPFREVVHRAYSRALVPTTTKPPAAAAHVATAPRPGALFATSSSSNVRADGSSEAPVEAEGREDDVAPSSDTARSLVSRPSAPLAISAGLSPSLPGLRSHEGERLLFVRPERVRGRVRSSQKIGLCLNCLPVVFANVNYGHMTENPCETVCCRGRVFGLDRFASNRKYHVRPNHREGFQHLIGAQATPHAKTIR